MTVSTIAHVEAIPIRVERDVPYLGPLEPGVRTTPTGYFVRPGNRSVYPVHDQSVLVRIECDDGVVGWGECVAFVVPQAHVAIVEELLGPVLIGRDATDPAVIYHDLYDMMRVRGFFGGFYHDCLAAIDIALWDALGKRCGFPLCKLLGGRRRERIPAYVSGLPEPTLDGRAELATTWKAKGFSAFKFASAVSHDGTAEEMRVLRAALGDDVDILCDLHWKHTAPAAIKLIDKLDEHDLRVAEAPCRPEDIAGQAQVAAAVRCPVGIGEELRTVHEFLPRLERRVAGVLQPEMARTGVTSFMAIAALGEAFGCEVMPHASIGLGLFQAASLHASAVIRDLPYHEYQHSIFDRCLPHLTGDMACGDGQFTLPTGPGLGVEPKPESLPQLRLTT
ncbi:MAG: mandelate racemase/muconate lactonizing enzyme family protein [Planctomycetota bacterium]